MRPRALFGAAADLMEPLVLEHAYGSVLGRERLSRNCRQSLIRRLTSGKQTRRDRLDSDAGLTRMSSTDL